AALAIRGVIAAGSANIGPLRGSGWNEFVEVVGRSAGERVLADFDRISPEYFKTVAIPLLAGRDFGAGDTVASPPVAIINQTMARKLGAENPLGQRFHMPESDTPAKSYEIVGIVADSKYRKLQQEIGPIVYVAADQDPDPGLDTGLLVRTGLPPADITPSLKRAVAEVAPSATMDFEVWSTTIAESVVRERLMAMLSSFFGFLAALLAGVGLYGVVAYSVARRTHEIGIRMALGADKGRIASMILAEAARMLGVGLLAGVALALAVTRTARALLYGLAPDDPLTIALAVGLMAALTLLASFLPARRAARVDPMMALREE